MFGLTLYVLRLSLGTYIRRHPSMVGGAIVRTPKPTIKKKVLYQGINEVMKVGQRGN